MQKLGAALKKCYFKARHASVFRLIKNCKSICDPTIHLKLKLMLFCNGIHFQGKCLTNISCETSCKSTTKTNAARWDDIHLALIKVLKYVVLILCHISQHLFTEIVYSTLWKWAFGHILL